MENKNRYIGYIAKFLGFILCFALIYFKDLNLQFINGIENDLRFAGITSGSLLLLDLIIFILENRKRLKTILISFNPFKRFKKLRLSFSYLLKIEKEDYLLVYNELNNRYVPVGGVYKYDPKETYKLFEKCRIERDTKTIVTNGEYDLRIFLNDRFKLKNILDWFDKFENRELDPWREFNEELISTGILSKDHFQYINYTKMFEINTGIHKDNYRDNQDSLKIYTIFKVDDYNSSHNQALELLKVKHDNRVIWASAEDIRNGSCTVNGTKFIISPTAKLLLNRYEDPKEYN
jgi:hypothetical protein